MYLVSYSAQSRYVFAPEKETAAGRENTLDHSASIQAAAADLQDSKSEASLPTPATPTPAAVHSLRARAAVGSHNDTFRLSRAS